MAKLNRKCLRPGCYNLAVDGSHGCAEHYGEGRNPEPRKPKPSGLKHGQLYRSARWRKASASYRASHPVCEHCRERLSEHVDHKTPHNGDVSRFFDHGNWQALCASCHSRKSGMTSAAERKRRQLEAMGAATGKRADGWP